MIRLKDDTLIAAHIFVTWGDDDYSGDMMGIVSRAKGAEKWRFEWRFHHGDEPKTWYAVETPDLPKLLETLKIITRSTPEGAEQWFDEFDPAIPGPEFFRHFRERSYVNVEVLPR